MASPSERRARRKAKQELDLDQSLKSYQSVVERCGPAWDEAWTQLQALDVPFVEFSSTRWKCTQCPNLMACTLANNVQAA